MKTAIPKIKMDFASTLPKIIADFLYKGVAGKPLFIHVNFNESIDFYSFSPDWELLELKIKDGLIKDKTRNQLTFETIVPYLEAYSLGFIEGFNELEQHVNSGLFANDEIKARKVFEFSHSWRSGAFPEQAGDGKPGHYITKDLWQQAGIDAGHFYKAWYIIANNHEPFLKYFEKPEPDIHQKTDVKSFSWTGSKAQLEALCQALIDADYIDRGTTKEAFTAIFAGQPIDNNLIRVTWIKAGRNRKTNKLALIDLLTLLKIPKSEIEDNNKVKACFSDIHGNSITFSQANLTGNKSNDHSEFYPDLADIFKSL